MSNFQINYVIYQVLSFDERHSEIIDPALEAFCMSVLRYLGCPIGSWYDTGCNRLALRNDVGFRVMCAVFHDMLAIFDLDRGLCDCPMF